jgi:tRNA pseudouridine65 synthase
MPEKGLPASTEARLTIIYEDDDLVCINKPSGMLVHRGWGKDGVPALQLLRDQLGQRLYPVHRLDRATSGALLFAKKSSVVREMQALFQSDSVTKRYLALCRGTDPELRWVDHPLSKEADDGEKRPAQTAFRFLGGKGRYGLYEARPKTGRAHQIRRHLKHVSHPIIGDVRYGKGEHNRHFRETYDFHRLALHCAALSFAHPRTGARMWLEAELPDDFRALLVALGLTTAASTLSEE